MAIDTPSADAFPAPPPPPDREQSLTSNADVAQPHDDGDSAAGAGMQPHPPGTASDALATWPDATGTAPQHPSTPTTDDAPAADATIRHRAEDEGSEEPADTDVTDDLADCFSDDALVAQNVVHNAGTMIGIQIQREIQRLRGLPLTAREVDEHLRTYVRHEEDHKKIADILGGQPLVVLYGEDGSGRYTTALDVLRQRMGSGIRLVRREPGDAFAVEYLTDRNTGWILDLRSEDEQLPPGFGRTLLTDAPLLTDAGSCLVVLTHPRAWSRGGSGAANLACALSRPQARDVLRAHLEKPRLPIDASRWLGESRIAEGIEGKSPAEVASWAQAIHTAERLDRRSPNAATPDEDRKRFEKLVDHVVQATEDWRSKLLSWQLTYTDSDYRNYLLAAAALDGAPAETVYDASQQLARALGEHPEPRPGQQGLGVVALTDAINGYLGSGDTVCFDRPGYTEAVVDYFWADRPHLAGKFTSWTATQAATLPEDLAAPLAFRVSQWALRYTVRKRTTRLLRAIAQEWSPPTALPSHARDLLIAAALDPATGQRARDAYLTWARDDSGKVPASLKSVLAQACEQLAAVYPKSMLLRLTELAQDETVADAVGQALTALWDQPSQRRTIQDSLTAWSQGADAARKSAAHLAFAHLAVRTTGNALPALLASQDDDLDTDWITARWRGALDTNAKHPTTYKAFTVWMNAALGVPGIQEQILQIFINAVHRPTDPVYAARRFLTASHFLFAWAPSEPGQAATAHTELRDHLMTTLRQADPAAPPPDHAPTP